MALRAAGFQAVRMWRLSKGLFLMRATNSASWSTPWPSCMQMSGARVEGRVEAFDWRGFRALVEGVSLGVGVDKCMAEQWTVVDMTRAELWELGVCVYEEFSKMY